MSNRRRRRDAVAQAAAPNALPRLAAPLLFAAALLVSFQLRRDVPVEPQELPPGNVPLPSPADIRAAYEAAVAPGAPGYDRGVTSAPVTVVEFADFGCRYCASFTAQTWPALAREYVAGGRVRWKYVPFVLGMFPNGAEAARAAECGAEQGTAAFGRMHDALYARKDEWSRAGNAAAAFRAVARSARLDLARFDACWERPAAQGRVRASNLLAERMGVFSTPTFFVNGARLEGAVPPDQFRAILDAALREAR
jgi:protein-disulfide isomerase